MGETLSDRLRGTNALFRMPTALEREAADTIDALVQALYPFLNGGVPIAPITREEYGYIQNARAALAKAKGDDNG